MCYYVIKDSTGNVKITTDVKTENIILGQYDNWIDAAVLSAETRTAIKYDQWLYKQENWFDFITDCF